jgi:hypothetical protein
MNTDKRDKLISNTVSKTLPLLVLAVGAVIVFTQVSKNITGGLADTVQGVGTASKSAGEAVAKAFKSRPDEGSKIIGESCSDHYQCSSDPSKPTPGFGATSSSQIGCCRGKCSLKRKDWLGVYWCAEDVPNLPMTESEKNVLLTNAEKLKKDNPELSKQLIEKSKNIYNTKGINEPCASNFDCSVTGTAGTGRPSTEPGDLVRCNPRANRCQRLKKDWLGVYWLPDECVGSMFGKPGTCN